MNSYQYCRDQIKPSHVELLKHNSFPTFRSIVDRVSSLLSHPSRRSVSSLSWAKTQRKFVIRGLREVCSPPSHMTVSDSTHFEYFRRRFPLLVLSKIEQATFLGPHHEVGNRRLSNPGDFSSPTSQSWVWIEKRRSSKIRQVTFSLLATISGLWTVSYKNSARNRR